MKDYKTSNMESLPPSLSSDEEAPNLADAESSDDEVDGSFSFGGVLVSALIFESADDWICPFSTLLFSSYRAKMEDFLIQLDSPRMDGPIRLLWIACNTVTNRPSPISSRDST